MSEALYGAIEAGGDSMKWYGLPTKFADDLDDRVKDAAAEVMRRVK